MVSRLAAVTRALPFDRLAVSLMKHAKSCALPADAGSDIVCEALAPHRVPARLVEEHGAAIAGAVRYGQRHAQAAMEQRQLAAAQEVVLLRGSLRGLVDTLIPQRSIDAVCMTLTIPTLHLTHDKVLRHKNFGRIIVMHQEQVSDARCQEHWFCYKRASYCAGQTGPACCHPACPCVQSTTPLQNNAWGQRATQ